MAVDNLKYAYKGNQLSELEHNNASGSVAEAGKFGYSYDKNGNMISDARKYATFRFNYLNLLQQAKFYADTPDGSGRMIDCVSYTWLADGTKASVVDKDGNGYSYLGSLTYKRSADGSLKLESATHGSGRIVVKDDPENPGNTGSSDNSDDTGHSENPNDPTKRLYENQYYITDHLGSVRVVFNQKGEVLARNDYYPFGKQHNNPALTAATTSGTSTNPADNRYLYNGKEKQITGGLGFLDYGARMSDPEIVRWHNPDQLAEASKSISPYAFTSNDPINKLDPDGNLDDWYFNIKGQFLGKDDKTTDNIRIMAQSTWNAISENGLVSGELGSANSIAFSQSPLSDMAMLNVFQYFNKTGEKLVAVNDNSRPRLMSANILFDTDGDGKTKKATVADFNSATIEINMTEHRTCTLFDDSNNIKNELVHEKKHVTDAKRAPLKYFNYLSDKKGKGRTVLENRAIDAQKKHPSWQKTTSEFKTNTEEYWKLVNSIK